MVKKRNELNIMVEDVDTHIIGIAKSWATTDISDAELGMTEYVLEATRDENVLDIVFSSQKEFEYFIIKLKGEWNKKKQYRKCFHKGIYKDMRKYFLLEKLIKNHLVDFLVKNNLIKPSQHGFLKARLC